MGLLPTSLRLVFTKCASRELAQIAVGGGTRLLAECLGDLPATGYGDRDEALVRVGFPDKWRFVIN
jgi:hypothetical protein